MSERHHHRKPHRNDDPVDPAAAGSDESPQGGAAQPKSPGPEEARAPGPGAEPAPQGDGPGAQTAGQATEADVNQERIAGMLKEMDDLRNQLLRSAADYQNMVRRCQQNIAEARDQAVFDLAKSLVNVIDHFDRALAVDLEKTSAQSLLEGMTMVRDEFLKALEKFGIHRIQVQPGDEFDPKLHQALLQQPAEGIPANHVAVQLEPGYAMGSRTVRPAKVAVAKPQ